MKLKGSMRALWIWGLGFRGLQLGFRAASSLLFRISGFGFCARASFFKGHIVPILGCPGIALYGFGFRAWAVRVRTKIRFYEGSGTGSQKGAMRFLGSPRRTVTT